MLIVRVGAMGDVLHALPAVSALRRMQPEWRIGWVVDPRWAPLLAGPTVANTSCSEGPVVSCLHLAETRLWSAKPFSRQSVASVLGLGRALREARYDDVVDMQGTLRSAVLGRFAGAGRFAGFADPRERAARWLYRQRVPRQGKHVVQQGAALLGAGLGVVLEPERLVELPRWPEAEAWAEELAGGLKPEDGRFVLLAPSAGWGAKQWPAERFGELAKGLRREGLRVLVNAAHEADPVAQAVMAASDGTARVVCGGVAGLVALTRRAALVVGGDSGPVHLAAALGTPAVALFGPTDPARNGPWGAGTIRVLRDPASGTTYKRMAESEAGLARMEVATVLRAALEALQE